MRKYVLVLIICMLVGCLESEIENVENVEHDEYKEEEGYIKINSGIIEVGEMEIVGEATCERIYPCECNNVCTKGIIQYYCSLINWKVKTLKIFSLGEDSINQEYNLEKIEMENGKNEILEEYKVNFLGNNYTLSIRAFSSSNRYYIRIIYNGDYIYYFTEENVASIFENNSREFRIKVFWNVPQEQIVIKNENKEMIVNLREYIEQIKRCEEIIVLLGFNILKEESIYYCENSMEIETNQFIFDGKKFELPSTNNTFKYNNLKIDDKNYKIEEISNEVVSFLPLCMKSIFKGYCVRLNDLIYVLTIHEHKNISNVYYTRRIYKLNSTRFGISIIPTILSPCFIKNKTMYPTIILRINNNEEIIEIEIQNLGYEIQTINVPVTEDVMNKKLYLVWDTLKNKLSIEEEWWNKYYI